MTFVRNAWSWAAVNDFSVSFSNVTSLRDCLYEAGWPVSELAHLQVRSCLPGHNFVNISLRLHVCRAGPPCRDPGYGLPGSSQDRNQMFWPIFARGPWPETFKASFSRTNQTANKRRRQKKGVKIFLNFTCLHKTQPGQKTTRNFPNLFEDIYSPDVWVSRFGCRFKYLTVWWRYSESNRRNPENLFEACLRNFKSGDKTS